MTQKQPTTQMIKIGDCINVQPGLSIKQRMEHDIDGAMQVVTPAHLAGQLIYNYQDQHGLKMNLDRTSDKYRIAKGDILFVSRGQTNYASYIESVPDNTVVSNTLYILKAKPESQVNTLYIAWCLNQAPVQAAITAYRTGAGAPIVQRKDFCNIKIPLPNIDKQKQLANLGYLLEQQQQLQKQLLENTQHYHRAIGQRSLKKLMKNTATNNTIEENI